MGIGKLLVVVGIGLGLWLAYRWFIGTPPEKVAKSLTRAAIVAAVALLVVLAATGRLHPLFAAIGAGAGALFTLAQRLLRMPWAIALAQRLFHAYRAGKNADGPSAGQRSQVQTRFIRMFLDHDSGEMGGEVIAGRMAGRRLSELDLSQLTALWREYNAEDPESADLLEAYLNRIHGEAWRDHCEAGAGRAETPADTRMSPEEARKILGVQEGAGAEEIISAHRRLAQKLHPDRGGSTYLAAKINRAKDVLLGK
ncbi:MAG TPA: molecular chaperone DnaJ [Sedimenticola sp.]|nr:molecular chaperone DnaJ [Sedimenticola sp.]